jgi:nitrite reductase (NADH) large subunit
MNLQGQDSSGDRGGLCRSEYGHADIDTMSEAVRNFHFLDDISIPRINTCGGSVFCPEGMQDSLDLGLKLEERLHNIYLPGKLCITISGCHDQCAWASDKDIGIVAMEDGWKIIVGGRSCRQSEDLKHPSQLATGLSTQEVIEVVDRIVSIFRVGYGDKKRLSALIEGIGFENFKEKVLRQNEPANK